MPFPADFLWGAASSAAQIEGAWIDDGRSPSIWDVADNHVRRGENCRVACDHYHRWREDVALMKRLGLKSYRFSVSWSRVMPRPGAINPAGIGFYKNLVGELKCACIEPIVTLYHWDMPLWLHQLGGWGSVAAVERFLDYAAVVVDALSDQVRWWITFNEPQMFLTSGYLMGSHAPFRRDVRAFRSQHLRHFLLAHGRTVELIRACAQASPKIGVAMAASAYIPDRTDERGLGDAARLTFESPAGELGNGMYMDPIGLGKASKRMGKALTAEDLRIAAEPLDFVGVNVYQPLNPFVRPLSSRPKPKKKSMLGWVIDPRCLYWTTRLYHERYHLPVMVTENGIACRDVVAEDGGVHDADRIAFIDGFLKSLRDAVDDGVPVLGYQHWSIMDNFEWTQGYAPRFGLIHVDYTTQRRTIKDSGCHYAGIIRENGANLSDMK